jgi:hypothetical protein
MGAKVQKNTNYQKKWEEFLACIFGHGWGEW